MSVHILACSQLVALTVEVGELSAGSKVERDFLLEVPADTGYLFLMYCSSLEVKCSCGNKQTAISEKSLLPIYLLDLIINLPESFLSLIKCIPGFLSSWVSNAHN